MRRGLPTRMTLFLLGCAVPAVGDSADSSLPTLAPPAQGEGFQAAMTATAEPYSEAWWCAVYDLDTTTASAVNRVEYLQNEGTHHMTLSTTVLSDSPLEPGMHACDTLYSDTDLMESAVMMFGNQGAGEGSLQLPEGVAALVPAGIQVVHEVHYVNATDAPVELYSYLNAYTIPEAEVTDTIWGGQVRDETIEIPAASTSTEWTRCVMNEDVEVHFLGSHSHALATAFRVATFDGTSTGEVFYENHDWHDPLITQYNPPLVVPAGTGFEYACDYRNDSDAPVSYGYTADDEMCNLTIVFTPGSVTAECKVVETSDGVLWP